MAALVAPGAPVSVLIDYGLSEKLAEKLLESGVGTIEKLGAMTPEELEVLPGIGQESEEGISQMEDSQKDHAGIGRCIPVYIALLVLSGLQVVLAYSHLDRNRLLASMLAVAIFSAALAIMYFMHMADERRSFFWSLIPATLFVLLMMNMIWSDSFRLLHMRPF